MKNPEMKTWWNLQPVISRKYETRETYWRREGLVTSELVYTSVRTGMGKFDAAISFQTSKVVEFIFRNLET